MLQLCGSYPYNCMKDLLRVTAAATLPARMPWYCNTYSKHADNPHRVYACMGKLPGDTLVKSWATAGIEPAQTNSSLATRVAIYQRGPR